MAKKDASYYLDKIIKDIEFINKHMDGVSYEEFIDDEVLNNCICFKMIQISENAARLPSDLKSNTPSIPWIQMTGLRNRIVHEYGNVDMTILYDTVTKDLAQLLEVLKNP